ELLPQLAARADKYAVVRTLAHKDNNHTAATHHIITGAKQPGVRFDKPLSRDDWPCYASGVSFLRPRSDGIPTGVTLPTFLQGGPLIWPGQHAGFLGPKHDPWQIDRDPTRPDFRLGDLRLLDGLALVPLSASSICGARPASTPIRCTIVTRSSRASTVNSGCWPVPPRGLASPTI